MVVARSSRNHKIVAVKIPARGHRNNGSQKAGGPEEARPLTEEAGRTIGGPASKQISRRVDSHAPCSLHHLAKVVCRSAKDAASNRGTRKLCPPGESDLEEGGGESESDGPQGEKTC